MREHLYGYSVDEIMAIVKITHVRGSNPKRRFTIDNKGNTMRFDLIEEREDYIVVKHEKNTIKVRRV